MNLNFFELRLLPHATIEAAVIEAVELARRLDRTIEFEFNGTPIKVTADTDPGIVIMEYFVSRVAGTTRANRINL